jgi:hypothetical protein
VMTGSSEMSRGAAGGLPRIRKDGGDYGVPDRETGGTEPAGPPLFAEPPAYLTTRSFREKVASGQDATRCYLGTP